MAGWPNSGPGFVAQAAKIAKRDCSISPPRTPFLPHFRKGAAFRDSWYVNWTTSSSFFSCSSIVQKKPFGEISPRETTTDTENGESTLREESSFYSREITPLVQVRLPSARSYLTFLPNLNGEGKRTMQSECMT